MHARNRRPSAIAPRNSRGRVGRLSIAHKAKALAAIDTAIEAAT
jgi:hypothetical protein